MKKQALALVVLLALGAALFTRTNSSGEPVASPDVSNTLSTIKLSPPSLYQFSHELMSYIETPFVVSEAWNVFQDYLKAAHDHDLDSIKQLTYQLSDSCADSTKESECFALMDNVYAVGSTLEKQTFTKTWFDDRQIVMSSEDFKSALFFTRNVAGKAKLLGLCLVDKDNLFYLCTDNTVSTRDNNKNGWWDDVEGLFRTSETI